MIEPSKASADALTDRQEALERQIEAWGNSIPLLSLREREVVDLAAEGCTDEQIAQRLSISASTVNSYWVRIRGKLGFYSRTEIVATKLRHEMRHRCAELKRENAELRDRLALSSADLSDFHNQHAVPLDGNWQFHALAHLPQAVVVTGPPATVVYANRRAHRFYRAELGELDGLEMRALTTSETPEAMREPCRALFESDGSETEILGFETPYYALRRDGSNLRALVKAQRFETASGPFVALTVQELLEDAIPFLTHLTKPLELL